MMKNGFGILIAVLLVGLLSTTAFAKPNRRSKIDKEPAALLVLGLGGYYDSFQPPGHHNLQGRGRHRGYWQGNHYGWRNQWQSSWQQQPLYRRQARTGFRIRVGDGYLEWWDSDRDSHFGYDSDRVRYRNHDRDRRRHH